MLFTSSAVVPEETSGLTTAPGCCWIPVKRALEWLITSLCALEREEVLLARVQTLGGIPAEWCRVLSHVHFTSCVQMIYSWREMWRYRNRAWGGVGDGVSAGTPPWVWDQVRVCQSVQQSIDIFLQRNLRDEAELTSLFFSSLCFSDEFFCSSHRLSLLLHGLFVPVSSSSVSLWVLGFLSVLFSCVYITEC